MPNWCYNTMTIHGEREELNKFAKACERPNEDGSIGLGMNHLYPTPQKLVDTTSGSFGDPVEQAENVAKAKANMLEFGYPDWYEWNLEKWGTKWGVRNFEWQSEDAPLVALYETAWSPADGLVCEVSSFYPGLTFCVISTEESDAFVVYSIFKNGELLANDGENPICPEDIHKLLDEDEDLYCEKLNDWQLENHDKWYEVANKVLENTISGGTNI